MKKEKWLKALNISNWVFLFIAMLGFVAGFLNDPDNLGYRIIFIDGIAGFVVTLIPTIIIKKRGLGSKKTDN